MKTNAPIRFHPIAAFSYTAVLFAAAMLWENPWWLAALFTLTAGCFLAFAPFADWKKAISSAIPLVLLFGIINAVFSPNGDTVILRGPALPLIGDFRICLESLVFGFAAGLKIALAVGTFALLGELMDADAALSFFSRFTPTTSLLVTLVTLMIPRFRRDLHRIREVMSIRGAPLDSKRLTDRVRACRPMLHVLLLSSLEGSWNTAEALTCRGFGSGARSSCEQSAWRRRDAILTCGSLLAFAVTACGWHRGSGAFTFYPRLGPMFSAADAAALIPVLCILALSFFIARSQR